MDIFSDIPNNLTLTVTDTTGKAIANVNVVATLYSHRSRLDPDRAPGVPVSGFIGIAFTQSSQANTFSATVPTIPSSQMPLGGNYMLAVDGTVGNTSAYHSEIPVSVQVGY